jgi:transcriptional regulator with XRE-family HTH domain
LTEELHTTQPPAKATTTDRSSLSVARIHVTQLRRYEAGTNQPTLDVLRALAVALAVSADELVFDPDERGPQDESLRLHLAALDQLDPDERNSIRALIEGALLRHQARRLAQTS